MRNDCININLYFFVPVSSYVVQPHVSYNKEDKWIVIPSVSFSLAIYASYIRTDWAKIMGHLCKLANTCKHDTE